VYRVHEREILGGRAGQELPDDAGAPFRPISRRQFLLRNAVAAGSVLIGEGALAEGEPSVTVHRLDVRGLREPVRLVQLTDLHRSWCVSEGYLRRVVARANGLRPDVALLTGDFVTNSSHHMASCSNVLKEIEAPLGSFAVLGNHDYGCDQRRGGPAISAALSALGIHVLTNRSFRLDNCLNLVGVDDPWMGKPDPVAAFSQVHRNEPAIILTHNPMVFPRLERYGCITVAGHTHGGQINLPIVTRQLMYRAHRYLRGWFYAKHGPGRMYVSRGIGVVGVPVRFRCEPEIALFELNPA
jgi:predicted MPP superfamily phosphohydrolase